MKSAISMQSTKLVSVIALLLLFAHAAHAQSAARTDFPAWSASDAQVALLAPKTEAGGFSFQPPKDYAPSQAMLDAMTSKLPPGSKTKVSAWSGPSHPDKSVPFVVLMTFYVPETGTSVAPPDALLTSFITGYQRHRTGVVQSTTERGTLQGLPGARVYFKHDFTRSLDQTTLVLRGLAYAQWNASTRTLAVIYGEDSAPYYMNGTSAAIEASALTLRPAN